MSKVDFNTIKNLFLSTAKIGAVSFGGGYAMIPIMEEEFVNKNKWVDGKDIVDIFAIAQSVPGVIALNTSTFIGYRVGGLPGAIAASVGVSVPSFCIIMALSGFYLQFQANPIVNAAFSGIRACVVALVFSAVLGMGSSVIKGPFTIAVAVFGFVGVVFKDFIAQNIVNGTFLEAVFSDYSAIACILTAAVIGWFYTMISTAKKEA